MSKRHKLSGRTSPLANYGHHAWQKNSVALHVPEVRRYRSQRFRKRLSSGQPLLFGGQASREVQWFRVLSSASSDCSGVALVGEVNVSCCDYLSPRSDLLSVLPYRDKMGQFRVIKSHVKSAVVMPSYPCLLHVEKYEESGRGKGVAVESVLRSFFQKGCAWCH